MNINGFGPGVANGPHGAPAPHGKDAAGDAQQTGAGGASEPPVEGTVPLGGDGTHTRGVVRLLQEGHFRGVADVRLRINFADEIAQIERGNLAETVGAGLPAIQGAVNDALDALVASGELDDEQIASVLAAGETFNAAVLDAADAFPEGGGVDAEELIALIEVAFNDLVESLSPIVTAFVVDEGGIPVVSPVDGAEVGPVAVNEPEPLATSTFLDDLRAAFGAALAEFRNALAGSGALPELSQPSGNGTAFDKFLAILNDLKGADASASEPIDTIA